MPALAPDESPLVFVVTGGADVVQAKDGKLDGSVFVAELLLIGAANI
jgi:hypothetical protein